jgi:hypothetical protein
VFERKHNNVSRKGAGEYPQRGQRIIIMLVNFFATLRAFIFATLRKPAEYK